MELGTFGIKGKGQYTYIDIEKSDDCDVTWQAHIVTMLKIRLGRRETKAIITHYQIK